MTGLHVQELAVELGGRTVLDGISFDVQPGEVVGLIGANGAGKSTALKAVLGIVTPDGGRVSVEGRDVRLLSAQERARLLAYVPQGAPVHWPLTAERLVALGRIPHLTPWQELGSGDEQAIHDAMVATDSWQLRGRLVTTLSGGERARVLLARTMAVEAPFMLADEPTASLDPLHQLQVMDIMRAQAKAGVGVLVVLHDLSFALRYCDRLVLIHEGGVLASGVPGDVLTDANLEAAFKVKVARWTEDGEAFLAPHSVGR